MKKISVAASLVVLSASFAMTGATADPGKSTKAEIVMKASFRDRGQAKVDRLNQDETQHLCSLYPQKRSKEISAKIEAINMKTLKYPVDGKLLGDWKEGEKIAQSGIGKQFSDDPSKPSGANCYACHQLTKEEISFGNLGPSLYNFGKLRGFTEANQKYAYGKIYNSEAFSACTNMPRFGHKGILTEEQMKHVTALLMDPNSPVNK
jgi:sulfur-oxidizing protein SoxX